MSCLVDGKSAPVLDGWVQIIRGPRPKSDKLPKVGQQAVRAFLSVSCPIFTLFVSLGSSRGFLVVFGSAGAEAAGVFTQRAHLTVLIKNKISSKSTFIKNQFYQKTTEGRQDKTRLGAKTFTVRISVKASPAMFHMKVC